MTLVDEGAGGHLWAVTGLGDPVSLRLVRPVEVWSRLADVGALVEPTAWRRGRLRRGRPE